MEYVWFNNVETKPSTGYPKQWEDQDRWKGGWQVQERKAAAEARAPLVASSRHLQPMDWCPTIDEYYEPYTFDYQKLQRRLS